MHHVHHLGNYITLLNEQEILKPISIIEELFKNQVNAEKIVDEVTEIFVSSLRIKYWMNYNSPLVLYEKYKKIIRFLEASWLISLTQAVESEGKADDLIIERDSIIQSNLCYGQANYSNLKEVFSQFSLCFLKAEVYDYFFIGLNPNCTDYPYNEDHDLSVLHALYQLIELSYELCISGNHRHKPVLSEKILFSELEAFSNRETVYDYNCSLNEVFDQTPKNELLSGIKLVLEILPTANFWIENGNPGNLVHYFHDYLYLLDEFWITFLIAKVSDVDLSIPWQFPNDILIGLDISKNQWILDPWHYLQSQFKYRPIENWRKLLDECLVTVLSNRKCNIKKQKYFLQTISFIRNLIYLTEIESYISWERKIDHAK